MTTQWYQDKADEIYDILWEAEQDKFNHPFLKEMIDNKTKVKHEYFARINYNMTRYGSSPLKFDDIDY